MKKLLFFIFVSVLSLKHTNAQDDVVGINSSPNGPYGISNCGCSDEVRNVGSALGSNDKIRLSTCGIDFSTVFSGCLSVSGLFIVDVPWKVNEAEMFFGSNAQLLISNPAEFVSLDMRNSFLRACAEDEMWSGISVNEGELLRSVRNKIFDGIVSINSNEGSVLGLAHTIFDKYNIGLYVVGNIAYQFPVGLNSFLGRETNLGAIPQSGIIGFGDIPLVLGCKFEGVTIGIEMFNTFLNVELSTFLNTNGDGDSGGAVRATGSPYIGVSGSRFENTFFGAHLRSSNGVIQNNSMSIAHFGILGDFGGGGAMNFRNNTLNSMFPVGILADHIISASALTIEENMIESASTGIQVQESAIPAGNAVINDCTVNEAWAGIVAHTSNSVIIDNCTVTTSDFTDNTYGIVSFNSKNVELTGNTVIGDSPFPIQESTAIRVAGSSDNIVSCNTTIGTDTGFECEAQNGNSSFIENTIGDHERGFFIEGNGIIGSQTHNFNSWLGNPYPIAGAEHEGNSQTNVNFSKFTVDPTNQPNVPIPVVADFPWFQTETTNQTPNGCLERGGDPDDKKLFRAIAMGDVYDLESEPALRYESDRYLYKKLMTDPTLLASDAIYQSFLQAKESSTLAQLHNITEGISELPDFSENQSVYNALQEEIIVKSEVIVNWGKHFDFENIPEETDVEFLQLQSELNSLVEEAKTINEGIRAERAVIIESLIAENEAIETEILHEWTEKAINDIWLRTISNENFNFSSEQSELLTIIANGCPTTMGVGVERARELLKRLDFERTFETNCDIVIERTQLKSGDNHQKFNIAPNPASEKVILTFDSDDLERKIVLRDISGKTIDTWISINENRANINLEKIMQGFYLISVYEGDRPVFTEKLIIR